MVKTKKGDTLIEVTIAIGIFSMVAIAIASVMNGGVSDAQTALETTLAREQIDSQAEALRFIHSSYINFKGYENKDNPYIALWLAIKNNATTNTNYTPTSCDALYDKNIANSYIFGENRKAFIIDTDKLGELMNNLSGPSRTSSIPINNVVVNSVDKFKPASTYPRLVYGTTEDANNLLSQSSGSNLLRAEGIYIVAIKDEKTTVIINESGQESKASAFYDFYIRTCWYGASGGPSTISTVIRLNDPSSN